MTLGEQLANTLTTLENAKVSRHSAELQANLGKITKDKCKRQKWLDGVHDHIFEFIVSGKVPGFMVTNYTHEDWVKKAQKGKAPFQDLWVDLEQILEKSELKLVVTEYHDGGGMTSWSIIGVEPIVNKNKEK